MLRRIVRSCDIQDDLLSSFLVARDANCLQRERGGGASERSRGGRGEGNDIESVVGKRICSNDRRN
jgi:hypothetical protein